jgi:hypothetical protein
MAPITHLRAWLANRLHPAPLHTLLEPPEERT